MDLDLDRVLDPAYLDAVDARSTDDLRELRAACEAHEEAVSYARRLLQGRLDILRAELLRREAAGEPDAGSLLGGLPAILAGDEHPTDPAHARATRLRVPAIAEVLERELDAVVGPGDLEALDAREVEELAALVDRLTAHERHLSSVRRQLFDRIDTVRDELARRYKDGRASVSELL